MKSDYILDPKEYQTKKCKWAYRKNGEFDPHYHSKPQERKLIYNNMLELMNNTPVVKLNNIPNSEGIKCEICNNFKLNL